MRLLYFLLACLALTNAAFADISDAKIKAYNDAVQLGTDANTVLIASQELAAEAIANPEAESAVLLAYEAGAMMCQIGGCADAKAAADFVLQAPPGEANTYPIAEDRALLWAFSNWSIHEKRQTRRELDKALKAIITAEPTMLSVAAFEARYIRDGRSGKSRKAAKSAGEAGDHLRSIADLVPKAYARAELYSAVSDFNTSQNTDARRDMANLQGWLKQYRTSLGEEAPDWVIKEEHKAYAWGLAMSAWFTSTGSRGVSDSQIDRILSKYDIAAIETENAPEDSESFIKASLPFCAGKLKQTPELSYNSEQVQSGFFGAVIVGFDIEDGHVANAVIKASVPEERFEEQALETVSQWTWQPNMDQIPGETCKMSREDIVQPLVFALD